MKKRKFWIIGAIAMIALILITIFIAPTNNKINSGSTYNRNPDGYAGWYDFMSDRGTPIKRWQKPFTDLQNNDKLPGPIALLKIYPQRFSSFFEDQTWLEKGNKIIILGKQLPATKAPFTTYHQTEYGEVKIDTSRRSNTEKTQIILGDEFGTILWSEKVGKGEIIYANTTHFAANAYHDFAGNYQLLAKLVTTGSKTYLVDEYLHGYKDQETIKKEKPEGLIGYLIKTPFYPIFFQGLVMLLIAIWAGNKRFGKPISLTTPVTENSQAYIQALAGVLQKANSTSFVIDLVGKAEQLKLQKELGLDSERLVDRQIVINTWAQQTGRSPEELQELLTASIRKTRLTENQLLNWLQKWRKLI